MMNNMKSHIELTILKCKYLQLRKWSIRRGNGNLSTETLNPQTYPIFSFSL